ncbi:MAG TPA: biotin/lipoyl-containing protein, partial [Pyrinomonadaceae bacterium]|nr:biotin/lipoyl-containing protein [Pyrinomonadaceae bacterium]
MATKVIMPKLSPTMEEGQISRWLKKEGDKVSMGEPLAEIDTDKATMEMQALGNGVLRKILIGEGQSAPLGQLIAVIGEPDEDIASLLSEAPAPPQPQEQKETDEPPPAPDVTQPPAPNLAPANGRQPPAATDSGRMIVSPLAARMAAEAGIDLRSLQGSGPGGRIIKRDIEAVI